MIRHLVICMTSATKEKDGFWNIYNKGNLALRGKGELLKKLAFKLRCEILVINQA